MKEDPKEVARASDAERRACAAPALEKGLDILEMLCASDHALSQKEIAQRLGRSVGEIYRMLACLVSRNYVMQVDENNFAVTTQVFEMSHAHPPTHRLLAEAGPIMQRLANELDQACHLNVYSQGKQIVLGKVDTPSGMGFSVRAGAELDVLISASGRVLLAFQQEETRKLRIEEAVKRRPAQADPQLEAILETVRSMGYESIPSVQVRGLYAISFPVLDTQGHAIAALTVPYAERLDNASRSSVADVIDTLRAAAGLLTERLNRQLPPGTSDGAKSV